MARLRGGGLRLRRPGRLPDRHRGNIPHQRPPDRLVKSYGIQAYACHPLMVEGRVLGTLSFGTRNRSQFFRWTIWR